MATAYNIHVAPDNAGLLGWKLTPASAAKVTELLQKDLENHHVFFNASGYHNHIPHHILTLYGTGATPDLIQKAYDQNASYQAKAMSPRSAVVEELQKDWDGSAPKYFGKGKHYPEFLKFFQLEIENRSWQDVIKEFVFSESETGKSLFARLFAGFLHPLIQLMYGIEWAQPAIVAEGLAQAAVHEDKLSQFLIKAEDKSAQKSKPDNSWTLPQLFESMCQNEKLATSVKWGDDSNIIDGVFGRAPDEALELLSRVSVKPDDLEERTVEMFHNAAYVAATTVFHPPNVPKYDFFIVHHLNSAPIFLSLNAQPWIPTPTKVRLLEWKMRMDLVQFAARGCPPLRLNELKNYTPRDKTPVSKPADLLPRFHPLPEDGHVNKVVRSLLIAQEISRPYAGKSWIQLAEDDMWLKAHYLLLEGCMAGDVHFVRSAGFEEAWESIPIAE